MPHEVTVIAAWTASYAEPLVVAAGETLRLTGRTDVWDGHTWVWAYAEKGSQGWIPDDLGETREGRVVARKDYSAAELTCAAGETLTCTATSHGWSWCVSATGASGWVPSSHLAPRPSRSSES